MSVVVELQPTDNNNISDETDDKTTVASGNGGYSSHNAAAIPEDAPFLSEIEPVPVETGDIQVTERDSALEKVKKRFNTKVWKELELWKVLLILLGVFILVIILSIYLSTVIYSDPDEKFDVSSFVVLRVFSGSVSMVNQNFTKDNATLHEHAIRLQNKLNQVYTSSHALARYFNTSRVKTLRPGSLIIDFCLQFRMPLDSDQLVRYTLSSEMVSNVLRQHLYEEDMDSEADDPQRVLPTSVTIQDGGATCTT
ncbi:TPA-induced transmembrane protein [Engraulis encrasicolus]|uniref:TPA-induced transmembrane protein n=1 Tax=Engraulis encrasicolus TaxID=184585 RepID=UPI002FD3E54C